MKNVYLYPLFLLIIFATNFAVTLLALPVTACDCPYLVIRDVGVYLIPALVAILALICINKRIKKGNKALISFLKAWGISIGLNVILMLIVLSTLFI